MGCQETSANIAKYERKIGPTFFGIELRGVRLLPAPRRRTSRKIDKIWQCHFCYWYIVYYVFSIVAFSIAFAFSADSPNGLDLKLDDSRDPNKQRNEHARMYARACLCVCFLIWFERKMLMMLSAVASDVCVTLHTQMSTWAHVAMERTGRIEEKALAPIHTILKIENLRAREWWDNNGIVASCSVLCAVLLPQANSNCHSNITLFAQQTTAHRAADPNDVRTSARCECVCLRTTVCKRRGKRIWSVNMAAAAGAA